MKYRQSWWMAGILGWLLIAVVPLLEAAQYQVQIANLDEKIFLRHVDTQGTPFQIERHVLPELEMALTHTAHLRYLLLSDYEVQFLPTALATAGQVASLTTVQVLPTWQDTPWMTIHGESIPEHTAVFRLRSRHND
jgi:hypothetical protein